MPHSPSPPSLQPLSMEQGAGPPDNTARAPRQSSGNAQLRLYPQEPPALLGPSQDTSLPLAIAIPALAPPGPEPCAVSGILAGPSVWDGHGVSAQGCVGCRGQRCQAPAKLPRSPPLSLSPSARGSPASGPLKSLGTPTRRHPQTEQGHSSVGPRRPRLIWSRPGLHPMGLRGLESTARAGMSPGREHPAHPRGCELGRGHGAAGAPLGARLGVPALEGQVPGSAAAAVRGAAVRGEPLLLRGWRHVSISHGRVNGSPHTSQRRQGQLRTGGVNSDTSANGPGIPRLLPPARSGASLGELDPSRWAQGHRQMRPAESPQDTTPPQRCLGVQFLPRPLSCPAAPQHTALLGWS